ncbi:MAG: hypothetical protein ACC742_00730 [Thermoanaerobaculales bacterium]
MRRAAILFVLVVLAGAPVWAQETSAPQESKAITHGEFSVLLLKVALGYTDTIPDAETALEKVKRLGLVPATWEASGELTHGEFSDVLFRFGVTYVPADRDAPASGPYVEAFLRRSLSRLRDYMARRMGHGFSTSHVLDLGVDRAVSPSDFD